MLLHKDDPRSVGGYKLVDRLGSGGMGVVYRGRARSGREVAVKVVHSQYAEDPVFRARFRQEIEAVRKVSGAFTAPVVDADPEAVRPWMATQYVPGLSLAARIGDQGPLKGTELRRLTLGLVEALRDIHRAGWSTGTSNPPTFSSPTTARVSSTSASRVRPRTTRPSRRPGR